MKILLKKALRFLIGLLLGLGIALMGLAIALYLSRDTLFSWLKELLSHSFSARITVRDIQIGNLRDLPALSLSLRGFLLQSFKGDTLFQAKEASLHLNLWEALVEKNYRIIGLSLKEASFFLPYDAQGYSPWQNILRKDTGQASPWAIEKLLLENCIFHYSDKEADATLSLSIKKLSAAVQYQADKLFISGKGAGTVEELRLQKHLHLKHQPFLLEGELLHDSPWLLSKGLRLQIASFMTHVEGGIRLDPIPLLSLRLKNFSVDWTYLKNLWPAYPKPLAKLNAFIEGQGEITGPIGRGHLPRLQLAVSLHTKVPFPIETYTLQQAYLQARLAFDLQKGGKKSVNIDSLFIRGEENDTLSGCLTYDFRQELGKGTFTFQWDLGTLKALGIAPAESLSGITRGTLSLTLYKKQWLLNGNIFLEGVTWRDAQVEKAHIGLTPEVLTLRESVFFFQGSRLTTTFLEVRHYQRLWDSTASPLSIAGTLHINRWTYGGASKEGVQVPPFRARLRLQVDTLVWNESRYGPLRADLSWHRDSFRITNLHAEGIARGTLSGEIAYKAIGSREEWEIALRGQAMDLRQLRTAWPGLDTLFPLLPHLAGTLSGEVQGHLPRTPKGMSWTEIKGEVQLYVKNLVVSECPYTYKLFSLIPLTDFKRIEVGNAQARLHISEGVVRLDTTWLSANRWRMRIAGSHTLRGEIAYDLLIEVPRVLLDKSPTRVENLIEETEGERARLAIKVHGTPENPVFSWKTAGTTSKAVPPTDSPPKTPKKKKRRELPIQEE
jgi:hypothetical protein